MKRSPSHHYNWVIGQLGNWAIGDFAPKYLITKVPKCQKGFTLLEVIVAITISSLMTIALGDLIVQGYKTYTITADQTTHVAIARRVQDTIVQELREAIVSDQGTYALSKAQANELMFFSDIDRDRARERVRYWREGALFKRGVVEPNGDPPKYQDRDEVVQTLGRYLTGEAPLFHYYKKDGQELTPPLDLTNVTLVGITFAIDAAPGKLPRATEVETKVQLRNIQTNLEE